MSRKLGIGGLRYPCHNDQEIFNRLWMVPVPESRPLRIGAENIASESDAFDHKLVSLFITCFLVLICVANSS